MFTNKAQNRYESDCGYRQLSQIAPPSKLISESGAFVYDCFSTFIGMYCYWYSVTIWNGDSNIKAKHKKRVAWVKDHITELVEQYHLNHGKWLVSNDKSTIKQSGHSGYHTGTAAVINRTELHHFLNYF